MKEILGKILRTRVVSASDLILILKDVSSSSNDMNMNSVGSLL